MFRLEEKSRQPCYAQPIQARLIPHCKGSLSLLLCVTLVARLTKFILLQVLLSFYQKIWQYLQNLAKEF